MQFSGYSRSLLPDTTLARDEAVPRDTTGWPRLREHAQYPLLRAQPVSAVLLASKVAFYLRWSTFLRLDVTCGHTTSALSRLDPRLETQVGFSEGLSQNR
jgi:hypothetical protein